MGSAAIHMRPVEFHVEVVEILLKKLNEKLKNCSSDLVEEKTRQCLLEFVDIRGYARFLSLFSFSDFSIFKKSNNSILTPEDVDEVIDKVREELYLFLAANWEVKKNIVFYYLFYFFILFYSIIILIIILLFV